VFSHFRTNINSRAQFVRPFCGLRAQPFTTAAIISKTCLLVPPSVPSSNCRAKLRNVLTRGRCFRRETRGESGSEKAIFEEWYGSYVICPGWAIEGWIARAQASNIEPVTLKLVKSRPRCSIL